MNIFVITCICFIYLGAVCWFSTVYLTVLLGNIKTIKDNKLTIQFSTNNNIRAYRSWPKLSSSVLNNEIIIPIVSSEVIILIYIIIYVSRTAYGSLDIDVIY